MHTYPYLTLPERQEKPRTVGLTMVHDSGYGAKHFELILETAAPFIDYYKLRTFTHALYDEAMTKRKLALAKENGIKLFMGGNVAEFASVQGKLEEHFRYTNELGWDAIEISETYVTYGAEKKLDLIKRCADDGLEVIYEWGLKKPEKPLDPEEAADDIKRYLDAGVHIAIVEEGEVDMLIGKDGDGPHGDTLKALFDRVGPEHLMVECGSIKQTAWFMLEMGAVINLGNVELDDIKDIEPLRRGIGRAVDNSIYRPYLDK